jgi:subtilisin family serine protease
VVDTGIQPDHPDLQANIVGGENFSEDRKGVVDPALWADDDGHGTHVSGTIAALDNGFGVVGVAPEAKLFAAKVFYQGGSASSSTVADAIMACVARHVDIINLSMQGGKSDVEQVAVTAAYNAGTVLVAAAGNVGLSCSTAWPANYIEVFSISAVDSNLQLASFSSYSCPGASPGHEIDFAAPGVGVLSTYLRSSYKTLQGTSMAAPHVSGVVALMISAGAYTGIDSLHSVWLDGLTVYQQGRGLISAVGQ